MACREIQDAFHLLKYLVPILIMKYYSGYDGKTILSYGLWILSDKKKEKKRNKIF